MKSSNYYVLYYTSVFCLTIVGVDNFLFPVIWNCRLTWLAACFAAFGGKFELGWTDKSCGLINNLEFKVTIFPRLIPGDFALKFIVLLPPLLLTLDLISTADRVFTIADCPFAGDKFFVPPTPTGISFIKTYLNGIYFEQYEKSILIDYMIIRMLHFSIYNSFTFFPVALSLATTVFTLLSILEFIEVGVMESFEGVDNLLESIVSILTSSDFVTEISFEEAVWK